MRIKLVVFLMFVFLFGAGLAIAQTTTKTVTSATKGALTCRVKKQGEGLGKEDHKVEAFSSLGTIGDCAVAIRDIDINVGSTGAQSYSNIAWLTNSSAEFCFYFVAAEDKKGDGYFFVCKPPIK